MSGQKPRSPRRPPIRQQRPAVAALMPRHGLARAISRLGAGSRSQAAKWIGAGRVAVNDRIVLDPEMPVDVRSVSLVVIAVLACVFALRWASAVFVPLMLSLVLVYALSPVDWKAIAAAKRGEGK